MTYRLRCLSLAFALSMAPGIARAQTVIPISALPPVKFAVTPDYRLKGVADGPAKIRSRAAMLERLYAPDAGFGGSDHHHVATFALGGIEVTTEAMREQMRAGIGGSSGRSIGKGRVVERVWAVGAHADWAVGANDSLSFGVAADKNKRAEVSILPDRTHIKGTGVATEIAWTHDEHLRLSLGWRADMNTSKSTGVERMAEIAEGAGLREQGMRMTVAWLLPGGDPSRNATFGLSARAAQVAADDLAAIGNGRRQDMQAGLFFRTLF